MVPVLWRRCFNRFTVPSKEFSSTGAQFRTPVSQAKAVLQVFSIDFSLFSECESLGSYTLVSDLQASFVSWGGDVCWPAFRCGVAQARRAIDAGFERFLRGF